MKWITRPRVRLDRCACAWLILRRIDPDAVIAFVEAADMDAAIEEGALPFHNTTLEEPDPGERISFEMLITEYKLDQADPALVLMGEIIHGAETNDPDALPEGEGLRAITKGTNALVHSDEEMVARMLPIFDGLYSYCHRRVLGRRGWANAEPREHRAAPPSGAPRV